jgi:hypothetical protein
MFDTTVSSRPGSRSSRRNLRALALAALAAGTVSLGSPRLAHAEEVSPDGKGIVGGALLGGEIVVFIEALAGVRSGTAYLLGAGGGAVAGGLGGYAIEQAVDDGRVPAYMLAGGLALVIPALVVTLDQTRYLPAEGAREDRPTNLPASDPGKPGGSAVIGAEPPQPVPGTPPPSGTPNATPPSGVTPTPAPAPTPTPAPGGGSGGGGNPSKTNSANGPQSLFNVRGGSFKVGLPVPEVRPVFTASQKKALGVEGAGSELRFPVVGLTF